MPVPACGSRCAREGASSEAEPARGRRGPSSEAEACSRESEPSSEADLARGGALLGRSGGPWGPPRCGPCRVCMFCVRLEVCFVFLQVLSRIPPGFLGDPHGCPRQVLLYSPTFIRSHSENIRGSHSDSGPKEEFARLKAKVISLTSRGLGGCE
jgi:hypothetical protein